MSTSADAEKNEVGEKLRISLSELNGKGRELEDPLSFDSVIRDYLRCIHDSMVTDRKGLIDIENRIDQLLGTDIRLLYHKILVYRLYVDNIDQIGKQNLPEGVVAYLGQDFKRIIDLAEKGNAAKLSFSDYQFLSYVEKLCFKSLPFGNQDVTLSGVPRNLIIKQSFKNSLKMLLLFLSMGGNKPLFEVHYNPHRLRLFNPEGWNEVFSLAAQTLKVRKEVRGLFGAAWFYDPALKEISPELYYIRELIEKIGGEFFLVGSSEDDKKNAFFASNVRKKAYEEGRYNPTGYMAIIKRDSLLRYYV